MIDLLSVIKDFRVCFIGETIIDEYHYVTPLGKSPKEHLISVQYERKEIFRGGVEAAAKHLQTFCDVVHVYARTPVVRKVRMVDPLYLRKLFEIHYLESAPSHEPPAQCWELLASYDVVVVTDFGHGGISDQMISRLCDLPVFLAVNAQTNSSNVGFNLVTKYPRADYICVDEPEARLAMHDRKSPIEDVMRKLADATRCSRLVVTRGSKGAVGRSADSAFYEDKEFTYSDAMTQDVVDTMGAGDAFFAITAPFAKIAPMKDLLAIGNAAGALKTQIVGHRESVTLQHLIEYLVRSE